MILKDFQCEECSNIFEELIDKNDTPVCPECKGKCSTIYIKALRAVGLNEFNAHYDMQMGQYFESREDRKAFLERTNRVADGPESPRQSTKSRIVCSKSQAKRLANSSDLKQGEI